VVKRGGRRGWAPAAWLVWGLVWSARPMKAQLYVWHLDSQSVSRIFVLIILTSVSLNNDYMQLLGRTKKNHSAIIKISRAFSFYD
jgi:hypothetical protein